MTHDVSFQTVLPLTINCETTPEQSKQNGIPSTQAILNLVASKYLKNLDLSTPEEFNGFVRYLHEVRKVLIVGTHSGSLIIKVKCSTLAILEDLWDDYCTGHLNEMARKYLVTEEILKILGVAELILTTNISEEKYRECQEHFLNFHGKVSWSYIYIQRFLREQYVFSCPPFICFIEGLELDNGNTTGSGEESAEVICSTKISSL